MSERDKAFIEKIGIPVARVAAALNISRQALNRRVLSDKSSITATHILTLLQYWKTHDPTLYSLGRIAAFEIYPEFERALHGAYSTEQKNFDPKIPGEYFFLSGDFVLFRQDTVTASQLDNLCAEPTARMTIVVSKRDAERALRYAKRFPEKNIQISIVKPNVLLLNGTLIRIAEEGDALTLFGCSRDGGFVKLAASEGIRILTNLETATQPVEAVR